MTSSSTTPHTMALTRDRLSVALCEALQKAGIAVTSDAIKIERARDATFGDLASNVAMVTAKKHGMEPLVLAQNLVAALAANLPAGVTAVSVAGKGFINFKLDTSLWFTVLQEVIDLGQENYARHAAGSGLRVLVEFISANPTGPMHVGNGWRGSYGDALARLLTRCGYEVSTEYYVNDTGGQIRKLGESLLARKKGEELKDDAYHGEYVTELAAAYDGPEEIVSAGRWAAEKILGNIKQTLEKLGIQFDNWYSQASIEEGGAVQETIDLLAQQGLIFEEEGALCLKSTAFGDSRDRVLKKADGDFTYFAGDIAYHHNKLLVRKYDLAIDIFGADHHGHVASLFAGVQALGVAKERLEVRLGQMISLTEGEMSKRSGNFVTMDSLIDDIGIGAVRFLSLMSTIDRATTLDLKMARSTTMENPVHYVRYAYARICSIGKQREERGLVRLPLDQVDLTKLEQRTELAMLQSLADLPDVVLAACNAREPHQITTWLRVLAGQFHSFYGDCKVLGDQVTPEVSQARLWLLEAVSTGLSIGLGLLGITAPERM
jgi:arginyl-tRNA synthetase